VTTQSKLAALSRLFSSNVFRELACKGKSTTFARLMREAELCEGVAKPCLVRDAFDAAFEILKRRNLRDEYVYKAALTHRVLMGRHSLKTASMLSEFRVGNCKADLVILNGTSTVYEIKSERDSLSRLRRQIESYMKVFASVFVIAGDKHVEDILVAVPPDVGVMRLDHRHYISTLRDARNNPSRVCPIAVFETLRTRRT
jgi:hypothetical protein